jgi:RNA recognition motif-containing protein
MTFKLPSPAVYFGSLLIALPLVSLLYWILHTQDLTGNKLIILAVGLFIGHLIGTSSRSSASQSNRTRATTNSSTQPGNVQTGETMSLYVGNLAYRAQRNELRALFEAYGPVKNVRIMTDRATRRPRGYAFVEMDSNAAQQAIKQLDNTEFCGRNLRVSEANQKQ